MASFYDLVAQYILPYKTQLMIAFVVVLFAIVAYYFIQQQQKPRDEVLDQIQQPTNQNTATMHFFTADWCPHCKAVKSILTDFKNDYDGKIIKNTKIIVIEHDCSDNKSEEVKAKMKEFGVDSFPTVKLQTSGNKGNNMYDFDAKITRENLENFLSTVL
jgi:thiol-disulfide isomerase/thioredoxin